MCYGGSRKGETPVGAPKKYTPKDLEKAVNKYFRSISRTVTATEPKPTETEPTETTPPTTTAPPATEPTAPPTETTPPEPVTPPPAESEPSEG